MQSFERDEILIVTHRSLSINADDSCIDYTCNTDNKLFLNFNWMEIIHVIRKKLFFYHKLDFKSVNFTLFVFIVLKQKKYKFENERSFF